MHTPPPARTGNAQGGLEQDGEDLFGGGVPGDGAADGVSHASAGMLSGRKRSGLEAGISEGWSFVLASRPWPR